MTHRRRIVTATLLAFGVVTHLAPGAHADPDIDTQSAAAVIQQLQEQGYAVEVKGVSSQATGLLNGCTVTSIDKSDAPAPDPTSTTTVYVQVACPIHR